MSSHLAPRNSNLVEYQSLVKRRKKLETSGERNDQPRRGRSGYMPATEFLEFFARHTSRHQACLAIAEAYKPIRKGSIYARARR
jgi:hypothetical protein